MSQRQQLWRILEIDRRVRSGLYPNADSLSTELEVSRRVIFNDRQFLLDRLGAPLAFDRRRRGWFYSEPNWMLPTAMMTQGEVLAFFLSVEVARRHMGTVLETPLRSAVEKIAQGLREEVNVDLQTLGAHYTFSSPAMIVTDEATLLALHRAIVQRQTMRIGYYTASRDEHTERVIHPHHLHNIEGDWHLVAYDHLRQRLTTFNVGRIEHYELLEGHFVREADFDAQEWLRTMFQSERGGPDGGVEVAIRFDAYQARYIRERQWHPTQTLAELPDGRLILRFQGGGLGEIRRWVMRYGSHAEVLEPPELRAEVAKEAAQLAALYTEEEFGNG